jgi:hypothetical protein
MMERVIDGENILISINFHAKEVPFMIFDYVGFGFWIFPPIYKGVMNYNFQAKILFNTEFLYGWLEEYGTIPSLFEISYILPNVLPVDLIPVISLMHITGEGYITLGGEGSVEVNQIGFVNPGTGEFMWPAEIVIIE